MLIVGYGANDPNVQAILSDIDEALGLPGSLIENIYFVEYDSEAESKNSLPTEKLIQIEDNRSVRVKLIVASSFDWIFTAFKSPENLHSIPPNLMRAIIARSYELIRSDIPRTVLEVDFDLLERKLETPDEFAKLFGITTINDASAMSAQFPYSITELGVALGGGSWHHADKLMKLVKKETDFDIKASDSKFQQQLRLGRSTFHKYSEAALTLLKRVQTENTCEQSWLE